ncbi:MAG: methyltransferase domain-containing protein [Candidatus Aminicenantales bacterium]
MKQHYSDKFYRDIGAGSQRSADIVLPLVLAEINPKSVLDVGCGTGAWLSTAKRLRVSEVLGLDGGYAAGTLQIEPGEFRAADLSRGFGVDKKYDLALCLEVGEHIVPAKSPKLVDSLTKAADMILFSAGLPGQGGIHHVNEQWPSFWRELFRKNDFVCIDCVRPLIYNNPGVEWWYRQNMFLFVRRDVLDRFPRLAAQAGQADDILLVHRSLLRKRYGFVRSFLYPIKVPIAAVLSKLGLRP